MRNVDASEFWNTVHRVRYQLRSPLGFSLTNYSVVDYAEMECYISGDSQSGFALNKGELVNVFSIIKGRGDTLIEIAIGLGAVRLDCYDGYLVDFYEKHGFVEHKRVSWDDAFAPKGWHTCYWGQPDVVYMELTA